MFEPLNTSRLQLLPSLLRNQCQKQNQTLCDIADPLLAHPSHEASNHLPHYASLGEERSQHRT